MQALRYGLEWHWARMLCNLNFYTSHCQHLQSSQFSHILCRSLVEALETYPYHSHSYLYLTISISRCLAGALETFALWSALYWSLWLALELQSRNSCVDFKHLSGQHLIIESKDLFGNYLTIKNLALWFLIVRVWEACGNWCFIYNIKMCKDSI